MADDHENTAEAGFPLLDGRFLVEIEGWDASLHVGLASSHTPREYRFQGGLAFVRGFDLKGRVVAPPVSSGKAISVYLLPFGPEVQFGEDGPGEVGQLHTYASEQRGFSATLLIPEAALALTATCLGAVWKYLHFWTVDDDDDRASISAFTFSSDIHPNLAAWIAGD